MSTSADASIICFPRERRSLVHRRSAREEEEVRPGRARSDAEPECKPDPWVPQAPATWPTTSQPLVVLRTRMHECWSGREGGGRAGAASLRSLWSNALFELFLIFGAEEFIYELAARSPSQRNRRCTLQVRVQGWSRCSPSRPAHSAESVDNPSVGRLTQNRTGGVCNHGMHCGESSGICTLLLGSLCLDLPLTSRTR